MIYGSIISNQRTISGVGFSNSNSGRYLFNRTTTFVGIQLRTTDQVVSAQSAPSGYRLGMAVIPPQENGGLAGKTSLFVDTTSSIIGDGYLDGSTTITITVSATGDLLASINGSATVSISVLCEILGIGYISGTASISAQPTAADIAGEVWAQQLEGTYTARELMKLFASVLSGKSNIVDLGGGLATITFRDINDTTDRVVADMTDSERTNVTLNL